MDIEREDRADVDRQIFGEVVLDADLRPVRLRPEGTAHNDVVGRQLLHVGEALFAGQDPTPPPLFALPAVEIGDEFVDRAAIDGAQPRHDDRHRVDPLGTLGGEELTHAGPL